MFLFLCLLHDYGSIVLGKERCGGVFGISILKNVGSTKAVIWGCEIWFCSNLAGEKFGFPMILV